MDELVLAYVKPPNNDGGEKLRDDSLMSNNIEAFGALKKNY